MKRRPKWQADTPRWVLDASAAQAGDESRAADVPRGTLAMMRRYLKRADKVIRALREARKVTRSSQTDGYGPGRS